MVEGDCDAQPRRAGCAYLARGSPTVLVYGQTTANLRELLFFIVRRLGSTTEGAAILSIGGVVVLLAMATREEQQEATEFTVPNPNRSWAACRIQ